MAYPFVAAIALDGILVLNYLCVAAGLIMVIGGIWLLAKQKIYIDRETKQEIAIELPGNVRFRSNVPALAFFVCGFIPILIPVFKLSPKTYHRVDHATINGTFHPQTDTVTTYACGLLDESSESKAENEAFKFNSVPFDRVENTSYKIVLVTANGYRVGEDRASWEDVHDGKITLNVPTITVPSHYQRADVEPIPPEFISKK
jgi:hypothetical protein